MCTSYNDNKFIHNGKNDENVPFKAVIYHLYCNQCCNH